MKALLESKIQQSSSNIASKLTQGNKSGRVDYVFNTLQKEIVDLAKTYGQLNQLNLFIKQVHNIEKTEDDTFSSMLNLLQLFSTNLIQEHLPWFIVTKYVNRKQAEELVNIERELLVKLRPQAQSLVNAFGYEPEHLRAQILNN